MKLRLDGIPFDTPTGSSQSSDLYCSRRNTSYSSCAIYCRKSTDENLNTDFNSLDAQREAGENYIASQKANGWICLPERYDDGGYSGGNVNRPALQKLLNDCESGLVDIILTYKIDRLSLAYQIPFM